MAQSKSLIYPLIARWFSTANCSSRKKVSDWIQAHANAQYAGRPCKAHQGPRTAKHIPYTPCMYGIFTYKTGWFLGQMLINIPYMEHMGTWNFSPRTSLKSWWVLGHLLHLKRELSMEWLWIQACWWTFLRDDPHKNLPPFDSYSSVGL